MAQAAAADPVALRDDIAVRKVLELGRRTMRIAKDPRDNVLYTLTATGNISRVLLKSEDELVGPRIARGLLNIDTGEITWTHFDPRGDVPEGTPLGAVLAAGEERITLILNPIDDKMYALSLRDGTIVLPPRTIVAAPEDYGIEFPRALFIDAEGIFYIILDTELTNASSEQELYTSSDHGYNDTQGFDIGPDGSFYLGATTRQGGDRVTHAVRGWLDPNTGVHRWVTIASTEPIPPAARITLIRGSRSVPTGVLYFSIVGRGRITAKWLTVYAKYRCPRPFCACLPMAKALSFRRMPKRLEPPVFSMPTGSATPSIRPLLAMAIYSPGTTGQTATSPRRLVGCAKDTTTDSRGASAA